MTNSDSHQEAPNRPTVPHRWPARPGLSIALRVFAVLVPALSSAASAYLAGRAAPPPEGAAVVLWWLALLGLATVVAVAVERLARRLLPLAVLLRFSMAFPDRAPSRFAMARSTGTVRQLEARLAAAREHGIDDDPARAAEQILGLVAALSAHDRKTRGHSERVRAFTDMLASELSLGPDDRDRLRWAALLHDIGKLRVPPRILNKPGKPTQHEWERLKEHPELGARFARPLAGWLGEWAATIPQHHERFDGNGYPNGLKDREISLGARVVAVADSFEVMTAARAYKRPMSVPAARRELAACASAQFDPDIVRAFLNISLGSLWWTVGPSSWFAATPVLGALQRAATQVAVAARAAAIAGIFGTVGVVSHPTIAAASVGGPAADQTVHDTVAEVTGPITASNGETGDKVDDPREDPREDPQEVPGGSGDSGQGTGAPIDEVVDTVEGTVDDVVDTVTETAGTIVDEADETVDDVVETVEETVEGLPGL